MGESLIVSDEPLREAGRRVAEALRDRVAASGGARFAIAGGSAAEALLFVLPAVTDEDWKRVSLTWVDERCVPFDSPDSNRGEAYRRGFLKKDRPPQLELPLWLDDETQDRAVRRVTAALKDDFRARIDVTLLGMGEDGHIASLFQGMRLGSAKGPVTAISDSPKPPPRRMTFTYEILRTPRAQFLVAMGEGKRAALERVLAGDPLAPANALPELTIITNLRLGGRP